MNANPIRWFEIYVDDIARAKKFYETVFESGLQRLNSSPDVEMWAFPMDMQTPGASGALVKMSGFSAGRNSVIVYFACEDCTVEQGRVTRAGGQITKPKWSIGEYGFITLVTDTEGNMIGLHSLK